MKTIIYRHIGVLFVFALSCNIIQAQNIIAVNDTVYLNAIPEEVIAINPLLNDSWPDAAVITLFDAVSCVEASNAEIGVSDTFPDDTTFNTLYYSFPLGFGEDNMIDSVEYLIIDMQTGDSGMAHVYIVYSDCVQDACMWPGDTNGDGAATIWDLLPIGVAYGSTGMNRSIPTETWVGQYSEAWDSVMYGTNYRHIDSNGDGYVDATDMDALRNNYVYDVGADKKASKNDTSNFGIYIDIVNDTIMEGDTVYADIIIPEDIEAYGIAFSISHNAVDSNSMQLSFAQNSFLNEDNNNLLSFSKKPIGGILEAAITRTNQVNVFGSGTVASMSFVMEDLLNGKDGLGRLTISIDSVMIALSDGRIMTVGAVGDQVHIFTPVEEIPIAERYEVSITPNPAQDYFFIDWDAQLQPNNISITNLQGQIQEQWAMQPFQNQQSVSTNHFQPGMYFVQITAPEGILTKPIIVE
ncbi:MAG: T9SS type A sorting domain-containing protein [Chitinophagales bacterium]